MTTVRAQCPACGDVKLTIDDVTVRVCVDEGVPGTYRFRCPRCETTVSRAATPRILDLLIGAGAAHELWRRPAEVDERPGGPVLTPDDLLDLHVLLSGEGWFDDLVALVRRRIPE